MEEKGDNDLLGTLACAEHNFICCPPALAGVGTVSTIAQDPEISRIDMNSHGWDFNSKSFEH